MKITPVKGTNDYLPKEAELRIICKRQLGKPMKIVDFRGFLHRFLKVSKILTKARAERILI